MTDAEPLESYPTGNGDGGAGPGHRVERKASSGTVLAAVIGAMALIFGSLALIRAVNAPSGAPTAEDAVKNLLDAIASEDLIGVLQSLDPAERDSIKGPIEDVAAELQRLGILAEGFNLRSISGIGLDFTDVDLSSTTLGDGFVAVSIDGGTMNTAVIPSDLPVGPVFDDLFGGLAEDPRDEEPTEETEDLTEVADFDIVAVERNGGWYVSLWYSVAEAARAGAGLEPPVFGAGIRPDGAESAEVAVQELVEAAAGLDVRKVIALLPPGEASVLHDYAPLFLDDVEDDLAEWREEDDGVIEVRDLELSAEPGVDQARVTIEGFELDATYADGYVRATYGGGTFELRFGDEDADDGEERIAYDGECLVTDVPLFMDEESEERVCRGDDDFPPLPDDLSEIFPAITAVRVDSEWFVSPTRTVLDTLVQMLRSIDRDELEAAGEEGYGFGLGGLLYWPFLMAGTGFESDESIGLTPQEMACYEAEAELTEEEWDQGAMPPECVPVHESVRPDDERWVPDPDDRDAWQECVAETTATTKAEGWSAYCLEGGEP